MICYATVYTEDDREYRVVYETLDQAKAGRDALTEAGIEDVEIEKRTLAVEDRGFTTSDDDEVEIVG